MVMYERKDEMKAPFDELARELSGAGLAEDLDFYIVGRVPVPAPSSEHIGLDYAKGEFEVWYRDMGSSRTIVTTKDFAEARAAFVREAVHLAGQRGRGPEAGGR